MPLTASALQDIKKMPGTEPWCRSVLVGMHVVNKDELLADVVERACEEEGA